jgi:hypothetical protein
MCVEERKIERECVCGRKKDREREREREGERNVRET